MLWSRHRRLPGRRLWLAKHRRPRISRRAECEREGEREWGDRPSSHFYFSIHSTTTGHATIYSYFFDMISHSDHHHMPSHAACGGIWRWCRILRVIFSGRHDAHRAGKGSQRCGVRRHYQSPPRWGRPARGVSPLSHSHVLKVARKEQRDYSTVLVAQEDHVDKKEVWKRSRGL